MLDLTVKCKMCIIIIIFIFFKFIKHLSLNKIFKMPYKFNKIK